MEQSLPINVDASRYNLTEQEYQAVVEMLSRKPNELELEIFGLLWSEHASYKNSIKWLRELPQNGDKVLVKAGSNHAGVVNIGDGLACVFKLESHNHPCAVQPRLGVSIGMRTVARDVIAMGARPIASLSSLKFGDNSRDTARWLFMEVVNGLGDFEKGYGLPVVGGELDFQSGYNSSPIVNNMVVGVTSSNKLTNNFKLEEGILVAIIGAKTGKDGIDDESFPVDLQEMLNTRSISVEQLRDVSIEKEIYNTIQEILDKKISIDIQPIGSQGLIGASAEMGARGHKGIDINTLKVPVREPLNNREILLSETWGRMLIAFSPIDRDAIEICLHKNEMVFEIIGVVTDSNELNVYENQSLLASIPIQNVCIGENSLVYDRPYSNSNVTTKGTLVDDVVEPDHYPNIVRTMVKDLNVASKKWLTDTFDKTIRQEGVSQKFPSDAAFIEIEGTDKSLVATLDCNPNYMQQDAFIGAQIAVAEASRNIVCAGGTPIGLSDCLNFGNPYDEEVYGQFVASIKGIKKACEAFKIPVISGNVSFYNQRSEEGKVLPIIPTPVIGMVGILEQKTHHVTLSFKHKGDMIFLIGRSRDDINGSEYLKLIHQKEVDAPPYYREEEEIEIQGAIKALIKADLVRSVHDISNGGLFFCLLESAVPLEFGFDITSDAEIRKDAFLFGESQSRVIVSVAPSKQDSFVDFMVDWGVPFSILGHVTKGEIRVDDESFGFIHELKTKFDSTLKKWIDEGK